jgi:hypothetical protein
MLPVPLLFLRECAEFPELRHARVDAAFHRGRVLFARVKFLGEWAVVADEERVLLEMDGVGEAVKLRAIPDS